MSNIPNILPVDFIDASRMAAALLMRYEPHFDDDLRLQSITGSPYHDARMIFLRCPAGDITSQADVPHQDMALLQSWPSARGVMQAIRESHVRRAGTEPVFGNILIISLKAGGVIDWHTDNSPYAKTYNRFHLCLKPSPGAIMFAAGEWRRFEPNELTYFNNRVLHSAINLGPCECVHLIVDIRIPDEAKRVAEEPDQPAHVH